MSSGLYVSASGAAAKAAQVDTVANNLANADTQGFKKDVTTFKEYLARQERERAPNDIPRRQFTEKDFYPLEGRDQSYVLTQATEVVHTQGTLRSTGGVFDLGLLGPGFFEVLTPAGARFTRNGGFRVGADGRLVNADGYPVLLSAAPSATTPVAGDAARALSIRDASQPVSVTEEGDVYSGETLLGRLSVVEFADLKKLRKQGGQLFANGDPNNLRAGTRQTVVKQGFIEGSNVNPVEEMTNLIKANRLFDLDMKAMKTHFELLGKEANDIGKL